MNGTLDSSCDGNDGVSLPPIVLYVFINGSNFVCFRVIVCYGNL